NGYGTKVIDKLNALPKEVVVNNTRKTGKFQAKFEPFNLAPIDNKKHKITDFKNACWITSYCGIGLNKNGYYLCGVGGGIDRVVKFNLALETIPSKVSEFYNQANNLCKLCGHFNFRKYTPIYDRTPVDGEPKSQTWILLYEKYIKDN
ncbi:MAG: hypothetical protein OEY49_15765, partial [Candidatus Heimdallarchaeota archaeon]|nr:hypothetical protein [Candidatus Heimdallarchaeota archaeon]